jgi:hypothetical protein
MEKIAGNGKSLSGVQKKGSKSPATGHGDFADTETVPILVYARPQLFAEVGNIKLYNKVSAGYLKHSCPQQAADHLQQRELLPVSQADKDVKIV